MKEPKEQPREQCQPQNQEGQEAQQTPKTQEINRDGSAHSGQHERDAEENNR